MPDVIEQWVNIQNGTTQFKRLDVGVSQDVYVTDEYVFKSGTDSIWKDMRLTQEARENGVNTPRVVDWSHEKGVVVYERIHSDMLSAISREKQLERAHEVGRQLSRLHKHDYFSFGSIDDYEEITAEFNTYQEHVDGKIQTAEYWSGDSVFDDIADKCIQLIQDTNPEQQTASILHEDYHDKNILVRE